MARRFKRARPGWFVTVAVLLVVWGLAGCASFYFHLSGAEMGAAPTEWDRHYIASIPLWVNLVYGVAVGAGLFGSIALLLRSHAVRLLYLLSLGAVIVQFGYVFGATDLLAHKGAAATVPFPLFIAAVAILQLWLAGLAARRGWIS